ncbi:MAG: preprotein translocase subunit SecA [Deltaproteobacteria bacterium]|nr:preprotein translocase subunit SecA [Deltaproteobacteria bacterium]
MGILSAVFGTKNERELRRLQPRVVAINALEERYKAMTDAQLSARTGELREKVQNALQASGKKPDDLKRADFDKALDGVLHDSFALTREAARRVLGMRHYDVQLIGGMVLHEGKISEMKTGEGKTLVATLPAVLNAMAGRGVHVVTVNDYLATRDAEWMGRIYRFLGLQVGVIIHGLTDRQRQQAYGSDITYGQNNEYGFDYLRDNMKYGLKDYTQRGHHFAIVDEVDSILIDEARTPLIISGQAEQSTDLYRTVNTIIPRLKKDEHYTIDEKSKSAVLTEDGVERTEKLMSVDNLYDPRNIEILHHVQQALRAHSLYKRDVDYVVDGGEVKIVDEHTGRIMEGRRWSDGLHQAIEAKEGVTIENETVTLATVTFQNFFRMYGKMCGMTGTADTEAEEFAKIYNLDVVVIPTNRKIARSDGEDLVYKTEKEKFDACTKELEDCYARSQPVLVGTTSVEKSEVVARLLKKKGIPHEVLNAKQHRREAEIIAQAGRKGRITISTNMAGRGTDILLGGNAEYMARAEVARLFNEEEARLAAEDGRVQTDLGIHEVAHFGFLSGRPDLINTDRLAAEEAGLSYDIITKLRLQPAEQVFQEANLPPEALAVYQKHQEFYRKAVQKYSEVLPGFDSQCKKEKEEVIAAGGLHILGTERHESRRIDNQLRGRAGRQGDPGSSRFYLSLQDDLMRIFGGDKLIPMMERLGMQDGEPIEAKMVSSSVQNAQKKVEGHHFDIRKNLIEYDDVMNLQRKAVYGMRRQVLDGKDVHEMVLDRIEDVILGILDESCPADTPSSEWKLEGVKLGVKEVFGVSVDLVGHSATRQLLEERIYEECERFYTAREREFGPEIIRHLEQRLFLETIDRHWKEHLIAMDHLREGIYLRGYGQKDPKQEYKKEGYNTFIAMMNAIGTDIVRMMFHVQIRRDSGEEEVAALERRQREMAARQRQQLLEKHAEAEKPTEQSAADPAAAAAQAVGGGRPSTPAAPGPKVPVRREVPKIGRNDPCYCGSGKKYKKCHLPEDEAAGIAPPA